MRQWKPWEIAAALTGAVVVLGGLVCAAAIWKNCISWQQGQADEDWPW